MRTLVAVSVVLASACATVPRVHDGGGLPFIEDDYPAALAMAKAQHRPLFVDAWAPW